ncbi:MAG TPA: hypothetical protein VNW97_11210 [Candidatus Saccharimonadales bacterium]|jgi:predicted metal-dependent phosphotriesterase family hydrolase|nr:hypothetical protein [Candidatus Saccharimonadales bacterium]
MKSGQIQTVLGRIDAKTLGVTDSHDHLFIRGGMPVMHYPDFRLSDFDRICAEVEQFQRAGGSAIVEMSPIDWGRDSESMARLSARTGVQVISATGFHKLFYYPDIHWLYSYSEEQLIGLVVAELMDGLDIHNYSGPIVERSSARAGVIKVGTQTGRFSAAEEKLLRVAAHSHLLTGAPILTHTDEGAMALEQVRFLTDLGVPAGSLGLSHVDRRTDLGFQSELAATGVFLEYDAMPRVTKGLDRSSLQLIVSMVEKGFASSILLGSDISRQGYWKSYGGQPGLDFLITGFRQQLEGAGLSKSMIDTLYVENPQRFLSWDDVAQEQMTHGEKEISSLP